LERTESRRGFEAIVVDLLDFGAELERMPAASPRDIVVNLVGSIATDRNAAARIGGVEPACAAEQREAPAQIKLRKALIDSVHVESRFR
jgi:hypothetical protein